MPEPLITAQELADRLGGALLDCPPDRPLTAVMILEAAGPGAVSFLSNARYLAKARASQAGLILAGHKDALEGKPRLAMDDPYLGFAKVVELFYPEPEPEWDETPIHATARVAPDARVAPGASIGARTVIGPRCVLHPGVHIGADCVLGEACELLSGVVLYRRTRLGDRVRLHANTVIGSDGFGYATSGGRHHKITQAGWVEIGDDVEIGALTAVDRAALGPTIIRAGTKIDNLCQVAHAVQIGEHCLVAGQTGIAGSTTLGDHVTLAGKVGIVGHIHIGSHSIVTADSNVSRDLPERSLVSGHHARPHRESLESEAALRRLPGVLKKLARAAEPK
jgi:UDP-3-O-[3-hydroxymyristoyl] glucosamine N-acyltransferase